MQINGATALVTGANRGIGRRFVEQLLAGGAEKVYAAARRPELMDVSAPRVIPLHLDLLDEESISKAAAAAPDATLLVNNAGVATGAALLTSPSTTSERTSKPACSARCASSAPLLRSWSATAKAPS